MYLMRLFIFCVSLISGSGSSFHDKMISGGKQERHLSGPLPILNPVKQQHGGLKIINLFNQLFSLEDKNG